MLIDSLMLTFAGMGSVFLFLVFLVVLMYGFSAVFSYIGPEENASSDEEEAVVAALTVIALSK